MNMKKTSSGTTDANRIKWTVIVRMILAFLVMGLLFFPAAGTIRFWEAWGYMVTLFVPMLIFGVYMFRKDLQFLERRMRMHEKRKKQKLIVKLSILPFLLIYLIPGLDRRWGWSDIPVFLKVSGLAMVLIGYLMILYVFMVNSYASRVVDVEKDQKVISSGPYSLIRHPMYTAAIILYGITPLSLGSYWALIPALLTIPVFVFRLLDEEKELLENLGGYKEYAQKVKWRLVPGIW